MTLDQIGSLIRYVFLPVHFAMYPPAYVDLPFHAGVKGSVVESDFNVVEDRLYKLNLKLCFNPNNAAEREHVWYLAGMPQPLPFSEDRNRYNLDIPLKVSIDRGSVGNQPVAVDGIFRHHELESSGISCVTKTVTVTSLPAGKYHFRVEALDDISQLADVTTRIELSMWFRK